MYASRWLSVRTLSFVNQFHFVSLGRSVWIELFITCRCLPEKRSRRLSFTIMMFVGRGVNTCHVERYRKTISQYCNVCQQSQPFKSLTKHSRLDLTGLKTLSRTAGTRYQPKQMIKHWVQSWLYMLHPKMSIVFALDSFFQTDGFSQHMFKPWVVRRPSFHTVDGSEILLSPVEGKVVKIPWIYPRFQNHPTQQPRWLALGFLNHQFPMVSYIFSIFQAWHLAWTTPCLPLARLAWHQGRRRGCQRQGWERWDVDWDSWVNWVQMRLDCWRWRLQVGGGGDGWIWGA